MCATKTSAECNSSFPTLTIIEAIGFCQ
jgi:hypothetical protein